MRTNWLGVALVALVIGGCGKKDEECALIATTAKTDVAAIKTAAANKPTGAKDLAAAARATADASDKLASDMSKKGPSTAELQKASGDYQAVAKAISGAARDYADVLDKIAAMEAKMRPEAADPDRKTLAADQDKVKKRCAEHPAKECKALSALMPSATTMTVDQATKLDGDIGAVTVKDAALVPLVTTLRASVASLAHTLTDQVDTVAELKAMQAKAKTASDALDAAIAKEATVTTSLEGFCGKTK
jgi:hypothetical protein